jgi:hypothetical protein
VTQAHSKAIWRESSRSGAVLDAVQVFLRYDGADVVFTTERPEQLAFYLLSGDDILIDLNAFAYVVSDGSGGLSIDNIGPSFAVLADDGVGGIEVTTDLSRAAIADLRYDTSGDLWIVRRDATRLNALQVGGNTQLY